MFRVRGIMTVGVLIVEDEFLVRMDAVEFMTGCGFAMYEAGNADDDSATRIARRHPGGVHRHQHAGIDGRAKGWLTTFGDVGRRSS